MLHTAADTVAKQHYAAWQQYQQQYAAWQEQQSQTNGTQASAGAVPGAPKKAVKENSNSIFDGPLTQQVVHKKVVDQKEQNKTWLEKSEDLWCCMEESGWGIAS